jgi:hypothetical protein
MRKGDIIIVPKNNNNNDDDDDDDDDAYNNKIGRRTSMPENESMREISTRTIRTTRTR